MQRRRICRYDLAHREIEAGDHHQGSEYREWNADLAGHGAQCKIFVILAIQHHQAYRDQVDDGCS